MASFKSFKEFISESAVKYFGDKDNEKFAAWQKDMISKGAKKFKDTDHPHWGVSAHDESGKHLGSYGKST